VNNRMPDESAYVAGLEKRLREKPAG
jgi:hypothetical protein